MSYLQSATNPMPIVMNTIHTPQLALRHRLLNPIILAVIAVLALWLRPGPEFRYPHSWAGDADAQARGVDRDYPTAGGATGECGARLGETPSMVGELLGAELD
jgi:hypothetical protein